MPEKLKLRDRFIPEKVVGKYFQIYQPNFNLSSPEERSDFLKLFFKVLNEYYKRFTKRMGQKGGQENDQALEEKFMSKYADQLKIHRDMFISTLCWKVFNEYVKFLVGFCISKRMILNNDHSLG